MSHERGPYVAMLFIQFAYAGMTLFSKIAISGGMNPSVFVVYRQGIAIIVLVPFACFIERKKATTLSFGLLCKIFFISLFGITMSLNLFYIGIKYTSATMATASINTIPVITFIMAFLLKMEKVSCKQMFGVAKLIGSVICMSGAFLLALYKGPPIKTSYTYSSVHKDMPHSSTNESHSENEWVKGSLLMILANAAWSLWLILQGLLVHKYPVKGLLTILQCFFSCIQTIPLAIIFERNPASWRLGWDANLLSLIYCGVVVTGITYWLQVWCIEKKGPVFTAMFTPLSLLITAIFSTLFWKELLHWGSIIGALLLVCGLYCVLWGKSKEVGRETQEQNQGSKEATETSDEII